MVSEGDADTPTDSASEGASASAIHSDSASAAPAEASDSGNGAPVAPDVDEQHPESESWIWVGRHRPPVPRALMNLMSSGWAAQDQAEVPRHPAADNFAARRAALSELFAGRNLVIPNGPLKVRSNDTDYRFRPGTDFFWLTGGMEPDAVLVLEADGDGHTPTLFVQPRNDRSTHDFFTDARYGEFWTGPRMGLAETTQHLGVATAPIDELDERLERLAASDTVTLRDMDPRIDDVFAESDGDDELVTALAEMRLVKDRFEVAMLQQAVDSTIRGFEDVVKALPEVLENGERVVEGVFNARARLEGNDVGYDTIAASGAHATFLHWTRNDGQVGYGDLLLLDAGVECRQLYTADVTRTIPVSGKYTAEQREIYQIVLDAQTAAIAEVAPGAQFMTPHRTAMRVLAEGLHRLGILTVEPELAVRRDQQLHRRWTIHGTSHMLGLDVHDCSNARDEHYHGELRPGYVLTVEPGLYFQPDDLTVPERYRGIGVRIEDDVLVTEDGHRVLSERLPRDPDAVEAWIAGLSQAER
ncbi:MAG: aminopeptidase P family protein [Candidatus Dormibacteraeota bacterium]|uniref:Xaa-Pro aminopeptidase n=1 Tax=Candidatus Amunia macphersoniae TaxID=3127014 RepID=A0A934NGV2_9BACT|nr:aminopeptidase P family protein [Candidatus Dormibacteraeota bacterium]